MTESNKRALVDAHTVLPSLLASKWSCAADVAAMVPSPTTALYGLWACCDPFPLTVLVAAVNVSGWEVQRDEALATVARVHPVDVGMYSGASLAVDPKEEMAWTVGYDCASTNRLSYFNCTSAHGDNSTMRLYGISLASGGLVQNVSVPLPFWDDLDDHHTTVHLAEKGGFALAGINTCKSCHNGLPGVAVLLDSDLSVQARWPLDEAHSGPLAFGQYIKGPVAFDKAHSMMTFALADLSGRGDPVLQLDLITGATAIIATPYNMEIMSLEFDAGRNGFWALASNQTKILTGGYVLLFYSAEHRAWAPPVSLGMASCASIENPGDNWSMMCAEPCCPLSCTFTLLPLTVQGTARGMMPDATLVDRRSAFDAARDVFIAVEVCQPMPANISQRVAEIAVATGKVLHRPLYAGGLYGLAAA